MGNADGAMTGVDAGELFPRLQQRYGLREDPLAMDSPFFPDAQRQHALESLRHLCGFGDMALLLTGAKGSGKTRILAELVRSESARLAFHPLEAGALTSPQALARHLLSIAYQGLGEGQSPQDAIFGFFRWSESATRKGRRLVLLVDNADRVPPELIRLVLAAHQAADAGQCAVPVLAGQDSLVEYAEKDAGLPGGSVVHQIHLRPLVQSEVVAYLEPRVQRAGGKVSELLSASNVRQISEISQGSFGRLKRVTPAVWLGLAATRSGRPGRADLWSGLKWPAIIALLLGGSWWLVARQYDAVTAPVDQEGAPVSEQARSTITLGPDHFDNGSNAGAVSRLADSGTSSAPSSEVPATVSNPPESELPADGEPSSAVAQAPVADQTDTPVSGTGVENENAVLPTNAPASGSAGNDRARAVTEASAEPAPDQPTADSGQNSRAPAPVVADSGPAYRPTLADRFVPPETLRGETGYTAQLIAGYEESTAVRFLKQYPGIANLHYTRTARKGRDWFVVFYGRESTRTAVRQAMAGLPKSLREHDSWIRPINTM